MTCWSRPGRVRSMFLMRSPCVAEGTRRVLMDTKTPSAHPHPSVANRDIRSGGTGMFRKEGEYWTISYGGHVVRLKDTKGVAYLAFLLRHPGAEYHALAVVGGSAIHSPEDHPNPSMSGLPQGDQHLDRAGIHIGGLSDAGEMLDDHAKAAYRRRLAELREALADAKQRGHIERAERVEQEIGALTKELARAVGLGGRNRRAGSASERARQSVSKAIKGVVDRLAPHDPALGHTLPRCLKTGTFCSYQPYPHSPLAWRFAAMPIQPAEPPTPR